MVATGARDFSLDCLRVIALALIILVHLTAGGFEAYSTGWLVSVGYGSVARCGVPIFFMISGALLLNRSHTVKAILRRAFRLVMPLVFWSFAYLAFDQWHGVKVEHWFSSIAKGPVAPHLWFLYAMICAYFALPFMAPFQKDATRQLKILFLIAWFVAVSVVPAISNWFGSFVDIDISFFPFLGGYMMLGAALFEGRVNKTSAMVGVFALGTGWIATGWLTALHSAIMKKPSELMYNYWSPNVIISSIGIFLLVRFFAHRVPHPVVHRGVQIAAKASFGIYLSHLLVLRWMESAGDILIRHFVVAPLIFDLFLIVVCGSVVLFVQRIPILRWLCPAS